MDMFTLPEILFIAAIAIAIILIVIGLIKKVFWICAVSIAIALLLGISQPTVVENVSSGISSFFSGSTDPLSVKDYTDLIDDNAIVPNNEFAVIEKK
jgi:hypothetical protein